MLLLFTENRLANKGKQFRYQALPFFPPSIMKDTKCVKNLVCLSSHRCICERRTPLRWQPRLALIQEMQKERKIYEWSIPLFIVAALGHSTGQIFALLDYQQTHVCVSHTHWAASCLFCSGLWARWQEHSPSFPWQSMDRQLCPST